MTSSSKKFQELCESKKTVWMGIINLTPDSFSDGGLYLNFDAALQKSAQLVQAGANILDFGAVSTNPTVIGLNINPDEEYNRLFPILKEARHRFPSKILLSVDTYCPQVAYRLAKENLVDIINDVYSGQIHNLEYHSTMHVAAHFDLGFIAMHMSSEKKEMPRHILPDVIAFFNQKISLAQELGISFMAVDPGIGYGRFGKNLNHILEILSQESISQLCSLGYPLLIGLSRKKFLSDLYPELKIPKSRDKLSKEFELNCIKYGAKIIRTHEMPSF